LCLPALRKGKATGIRIFIIIITTVIMLITDFIIRRTPILIMYTGPVVTTEKGIKRKAQSRGQMLKT
jgi:hypothetical protein